MPVYKLRAAKLDTLQSFDSKKKPTVSKVLIFKAFTQILF